MTPAELAPPYMSRYTAVPLLRGSIASMLSLLRSRETRSDLVGMVCPEMTFVGTGELKVEVVYGRAVDVFT